MNARARPSTTLRKIIFSPSILAADFSEMANEISSITHAPCDWVHLDVMDGHFVPNLTFGPSFVKSIRPKTKLFLDCHLMVKEPEKWIAPFADAGADLLTFHIEACPDPLAIIEAIREKKRKVGVSLNPSTPIKSLSPFLDLVDLVLVMGVNPGFAGQKYMEETTDKVKSLAMIRKDRPFLIEVDGGVGSSNIVKLREAGADVFVMGNAIFAERDRKKTIKTLFEMLQ